MESTLDGLNFDQESEAIKSLLEKVESFPPAKTEWFVISISWWNKWQQYVAEPDQEPPGAIDSSDILLDTSEFIQFKDKPVDPCNNILKPGIRGDVEYKLLPKDVWRLLLNKYKCKANSILRRYSIDISEYETQVEVHLRPIKFVWVPRRDRTIDITTEKVIYTSRKDMIVDLYPKLTEAHNLNVQSFQRVAYNPSYVRLWKMEAGKSLEDLKDHLKEEISGLRMTISENAISFPGELLEASTVIENAEIAFDDIVVLEMKGAGIPWTFHDGTDAPVIYCENCRDEIKGTSVQCTCKRFDYCNNSCRDQDRRYHKCFQSTAITSAGTGTTSMGAGSIYSGGSSYSSIGGNRGYSGGMSYSSGYGRQAEFKAEPLKDYAQKSMSRMGLSGLQNLGNTCFMNSGLQCMSNTWPLTQYFLTQFEDSHINKDNVLGTKGNLVTEYARLVNELWYETSSSCSPWSFKRALGYFASQFSGYNQQDSQELLSYLIDGIHEDLNQVRNKPFCEAPESKDYPDENELAEKFWSNHIARNQSPVVDLMHGQLRSEVICPDCGNVSIKFDPFLMHTLQVPGAVSKTVELCYIFLEPERKPLKIAINMPKGSNIADVRQKITDIIPISDDRQYALATVYNKGFKKYVKDNEPTKVLKSKIYENSWAYELPLTDETNDVIIVEFFELYRYQSYMSNSTAGFSKRPLGFPRALVLSKSLTLQQVYMQIYEYILVATKPANEEMPSTGDELESTFTEHFPKLTGSNSNEPDLFTLAMVNLQRKTGYQYGPTKPCDFCGNKACYDCDIPFDGEVSLGELTGKCTIPDAQIRIKLTFKNDAKSVITIDKLDKVELHESLDMARKNLNSESSDNVTIYDCLDQDKVGSRLEAGNEWYCGQCKNHVLATKKLELYRLPKILCFHFKRFKQKGYSTDKITKTIDFPLEGLDLSRYYRGTEGAIYDCYAVSNHFGSLSFGHYTAYCKNKETGQWYDFDDSRVSPVSGNRDIVSNAAYVIFYEKRE